MDKEKILIIKIIGQKIKNIKEKKGITLEEVAQKTGIRIQYLVKIEKGEAFGVNMTHIFKIAEALKVYPHELFEGL